MCFRFLSIYILETNSKLNIRYFLRTLITHHSHFHLSYRGRVDCNFHSLNTLSRFYNVAKQDICQIHIFRGLLNERTNDLLID